MEVEAVDFERLEEQNLSLVLHKMCTHIALYNTDQRLRRELDLLASETQQKRKTEEED